jgi:rod shape-determining protein MreD
LAALIAALIETSVLPEIPIAGATADLVLVCAIAAALVLGVADGLVAAFLGGLLIDLLLPGRPLGAATVSLLLVIGIALVVSRVIGSARRFSAVLLAVVLTVAYEIVLMLVLVVTENAPLSISPTVLIAAAVMNAIFVIPFVVVFAAIERRFGATERTPW